MKRRRFFQAITALPAAQALFAQAPQTAPQNPAPQTPPQGRSGGRGTGRGAANVPGFEETAAEAVGDPATRFFTPPQFAALRRLGDLLMPPLKGNPGALECEAPEFLDFLVGASLPDRQKLYRNGLDALNANARKKYNKTFADLNNAEVESILRPLMVPVAWAYDPPKDPVEHFLFEAHRDLRTSTQNSRAWAAAGAAAGRRGFGGGGQFVKPIDPIYRS